MLSLRAIRRKIKTVKNIQQITQAMKMVSAAKLRRVQSKVDEGRPYFEKMQELMSYLSPQLEKIEHPLLEVRDLQTRGLVVVTSDRGLCGSYNHNVIRHAVALMKENPDTPWLLVTVGRRAGDFFSRRGYAVVDKYAQIGVDAKFSEVKAIMNAIVSLYTEKKVDEVSIVYAEFINTMQQRPKTLQFLPIPSTMEAKATAEYLVEPSAPQLLSMLLPRYVDTQIYHILLESVASEYGARMTAMTAATDNANKMIDHLTLTFNKARQASITKELLEIVSGAEALKSG